MRGIPVPRLDWEILEKFVNECPSTTRDIAMRAGMSGQKASQALRYAVHRRLVKESFRLNEASKGLWPQPIYSRITP